MPNIPTPHDIADRLASARTDEDVDDILTMATVIFGPLEVRPVGGRPNNAGTVRVASDPGQATVERITNGMDAVLELHARLNAESAPSPRAGARQWLGIDAHGLSTMTDADRRLLAENLTVIIDESGEDRRPTLIFEDRGTGQHPDDFPGTLLSLNESNKIDKPYTMGAFGQGGSAPYGFSRATIILSRRHPACLDGKSDRVGWTIVREFFDATTMKLPNYSYYAPAGAGGVFELDPALLPDLPHGTRIVHVAYDLQGAATTYTTGIWQLYNAALFDPVLPFIVGGVGRYNPNKSTGDKPDTRVITGNATRLAGIDKARGDIEAAHNESVELELGADYGSVRINYWVLVRPEGSTSKSDVTGGYVKADSAVVMTLFGQRQDQLPRTWIKDNAKLPYLFKSMIVQIDADGLTPIAKRELFASTRERATDSDLRREIYDFLAKQLREDEELARLNHIEKERLMNRSTAATNDKIRQRLAKFITSRLREGAKAGAGTGAAAGGKTPQPKPKPKSAGVVRPRRSTDDSALPKVPTYIRFEKEQVRLVQGDETGFWVEINAKNDYLDEHKDSLQIIWPHGGEGTIKVKSKSRLKGGRSRWYIACTPDTEVGEYKLRAEFMTSNGPLEDTLVVRVVEPPKPADPPVPGGGGTDPGVDVRWVHKSDWEVYTFSAKTVGRVDVDDDGTVIWVNRDYLLLDRALSGSTLTAEQVSTRAERYQFPVACALWLQDHKVRQLADDDRPNDDFISSEHERVAEAVLAAMNADVDTAVDED